MVLAQEGGGRHDPDVLKLDNLLTVDYTEIKER